MGKQMGFIQDPGICTGQTDSVQTQKGKGTNRARLLTLLKEWAKKSNSKTGEK